MLIVPAEHKFDARHLPLGTLFIFLACTLVFGLYQSDDDARTDAALSVYENQQLVDYERPLLESWLEAEGLEVDPGQLQAFLPLVLQPGFDQYVREYWRASEPPPAWAASREQFEAARDRISWVRFGLIPAEMKPASLLGHMFLHGDFLHLFFNMIFLLLFGMLLERVLGTALFVGTYVITGLMAAGLFALVHAGSPVPLVGASGAISGLMGAYLGVYGFRKVRFFYTVGFWFGEFTAPALLIFPVWLAKEVQGYLAGDGPVAYMAHAGGLLGGLAVALLLKKHVAQTLDTDEETRRNRKATQEKLARIRQLMTDLHLTEAVRLAEQSIRQSPTEPAFWQVYAEAAGRLSVGAEYHRIMTTLFMNAGQKAMSVVFLRDALADYQRRAGEVQPALHGKGGADLARRFFREGISRDLDQLLESVFRAGGMSKDFDELLDTLVQVADRNNDRRRAQRYRQYMGGAVQADVGLL